MADTKIHTSASQQLMIERRHASSETTSHRSGSHAGKSDDGTKRVA